MLRSMSTTILPSSSPQSLTTPVTLPYFSAVSRNWDAIAQTAIPTVAPAKDRGRYSLVNGRGRY